ncbi:N-acetylmuramic acid 6-phosphate etherase [Thermoflexales bacterium]|nr:N-acetylmuramic acid 6-phosphate etherase [Thermoflexales bacterium]
MIVVGLMSGTSADGIDAAVVDIQGVPPALNWRVLAHCTVPYRPDLRAALFASFQPETGTVDHLCRVNFALGQALAEAVQQALETARLTPAQIDLIGSHGQTVWHQPIGPQASTLQIGEAAVIAERLGVPVVSNFRARDLAAGGQGAPLVAYVDTLLFTHPHLIRAAQNIGGIGNVTYLPPDRNAAFAFDTGPGNMLIDFAVQRLTHGAQTFDRDGILAAQGRVQPELLDQLLTEPYLQLKPPKTTGRELFGAQYGDRVLAQAQALTLSDHDLIATLTAFTARSIELAYRAFLPCFPEEVILSGGGARNATLLQMLRAALAPARVITSAEMGLAVDAKEAVAFALLAYETWHQRPGNLPTATGAAAPVILGAVTPGRPRTTPARDEQPWLTEARNPATEHIDQVSTLTMVQLMNAEDRRVAEAVQLELPHIAAAIDQIAARMQTGGRLIYLGAGTSGRMAVLDAAECPPTFNTSPEEVIALIAGGPRAITQAVEGAEDDREAAVRDLAVLNLTARDSVIGIAASGRTPYALGGLAAARECGALVVSIACNHPSLMADLADIAIAPLVGPEAISGSTRLKAGTAQKMVLNMISTGVMIRLGKTFGNLMVDVQPTNVKLRERARRIVEEACSLTTAEAAAILETCHGEVKTAIVATLANVPPEAARQRLRASQGRIRQAIV